MNLNWFIFLFQVFYPGVVLAMFQVAVVSLMLVGFSFEAYTQVGITLWEKADEPFYQINEIKRQVAEFSHPCRVDALVVDEAVAQPHIGMHEEHTKEVDCHVVARRRQISATNNLHFCNSNNQL